MDVNDRTKIDRARDARLEDMRPKDKDRPKEKPSDFDRLFEQVKASQLKSTTRPVMEQATEQAIRESRRREERESDQRRRDDGEDDRQGRDTKPREKRESSHVTGERVMAKGGLKDDRGGGGGGRFGGDQGGGGSTSKRGLSLTLKKAGGKAGPISLAGRFEQQLKASLKEGAHAPRVTQAILNQLVHYVRVGINQRGEKEIQIELHERIFRGLKLRVTKQGEKKVGVHFLASDGKTRRVFEQHRDAIKGALAKNGIQVDEIIIS